MTGKTAHIIATRLLDENQPTTAFMKLLDANRRNPNPIPLDTLQEVFEAVVDERRRMGEIDSALLISPTNKPYQ